MVDHKSVGTFILGIAFGLLLKYFMAYMPFQEQLQMIEPYFVLLPLVLIIVAVIVFVKG